MINRNIMQGLLLTELLAKRKGVALDGKKKLAISLLFGMTANPSLSLLLADKEVSKLAREESSRPRLQPAPPVTAPKMEAFLSELESIVPTRELLDLIRVAAEEHKLVNRPGSPVEVRPRKAASRSGSKKTTGKSRSETSRKVTPAG